jgi:catechol 2,3-dioxygenase-like lactoylglutathione lyase family enzyme
MPPPTVDESARAARPPAAPGYGPLRISEIVLRTLHFERLRDWYRTLLGVEPYFERTPSAADLAAAIPGLSRAADLRLAFFRIHLDYPYTQVLGIFQVPGLADQPSASPGLHHLQLRHASLGEVFDRYDRLKHGGVTPHRTANHGPGTSFYYHDPDGNMVELSAANFATEADYLAYLASDTYRANPSGLEIDADAYVARYRAGMPQAELVRID